MRYWEEAFCCALEEAGIQLPPPDKLELAVQVIEGAFDQYGMAHGHDCIPDPRVGEIKALEAQLQREKEKITCKTCNGRGRIFSQGPIHSCDSQCSKCYGEGRIDP